MATQKRRFLSVYDYKQEQDRYFPWPLNQNGRYASTLSAEASLQRLLLDPTQVTAQEVTPVDARDIEAVLDGDLQMATDQGNRTDDHIITGGYAMDAFFRTDTLLGVLVANKRTVHDYNRPLIEVEMAELMDKHALLKWLLTDMNPENRLLFCKLVASCTVELDEYEVIDLLRLKTSTTPTTPTTPTQPTKPSYVARVDVISCDMITGWVADRNNLDVPQAVDIFINDKLAVSLTAHKSRKDVADFLGANTNNFYSWEYIVPAEYRKGEALKVRVYVRDTNVEAEIYNSPQTTAACGTAPTTNPGTPAPAPYIIQSRLDGPFSVPEGGGKKHFWITDIYNDDSQKRRTSGVDGFEILEGKPAGLNITRSDQNAAPQATGPECDLELTSIDLTKRVTLRARLAGGGQADATVELVDTTCHRPAGQIYKPKLVWNAVTPGGNARLFTTLDDANTTLGRHFDGSSVLDLSQSVFAAEMANYNVGTDVFLGWSPDTDSCAHVGDNIYYVLNGDGGNGQRIAIQVVNGKIAASKASAYSTPTPTTPTDRVEEIAVTTTALDYSQNRNPGDTQVDCFMLWRVTGNPVLWLGVYTNDYKGDPVMKLRYSSADYYVDLAQPTPHPKPADWTPFTRLSGINNLNHDYAVRIDARLGGPDGQLLASFRFADGLPLFPVKTIYTAP